MSTARDPYAPYTGHNSFGLLAVVILILAIALGECACTGAAVAVKVNAQGGVSAGLDVGWLRVTYDRKGVCLQAPISFCWKTPVS